MAPRATYNWSLRGSPTYPSHTFLTLTFSPITPDFLLIYSSHLQMVRARNPNSCPLTYSPNDKLVPTEYPKISAIQSDPFRHQMVQARKNWALKRLVSSHSFSPPPISPNYLLLNHPSLAPSHLSSYVREIGYQYSLHSQLRWRIILFILHRFTLAYSILLKIDHPR